MTWVTEDRVAVLVDIVERLGHFDTLAEVNAACEYLWGPIERCEIEGSIPWFKVYRCQSNRKGYDLTIVTTAGKWNWKTMEMPCYGS